MKIRSKRYLGTFTNDAYGVSSYKLMVNHIRQVVRGGRFVKMFRGNSRPDRGYYHAGCSLKENATHFDVYLLGRDNTNVPKFYQFELK